MRPKGDSRTGRLREAGPMSSSLARRCKWLHHSLHSRSSRDNPVSQPPWGQISHFHHAAKILHLQSFLINWQRSSSVKAFFCSFFHVTVHEYLTILLQSFGNLLEIHIPSGFAATTMNDPSPDLISCKVFLVG